MGQWVSPRPVLFRLLQAQITSESFHTCFPSYFDVKELDFHYSARCSPNRGVWLALEVCSRLGCENVALQTQFWFKLNEICYSIRSYMCLPWRKIYKPPSRKYELRNIYYDLISVGWERKAYRRRRSCENKISFHTLYDGTCFYYVAEFYQDRSVKTPRTAIIVSLTSEYSPPGTNEWRAQRFSSYTVL